MRRSRKSAFTLIELLVVIAVISLLAAILFPVFAQARDQARKAACSSNMRQISTALGLYAQDYDETFPLFRFHGNYAVGVTSDWGQRIYGWNNAITPYLKSIDVMGCPANPLSRSIPGRPALDPADPPRLGSNAAGWEVEPGRRMPISYGVNVCAMSWFSLDWNGPRPGPPLRIAQLMCPADTIFICETNSPQAAFTPYSLWVRCYRAFTHSAGKLSNFICFDGHVRTRKWLATIYPVSENNWELGQPDPNPSNRTIHGVPGCDGGTGDGRLVVPPDPNAKEFQTPDCQAYR